MSNCYDNSHMTNVPTIITIQKNDVIKNFLPDNSILKKMFKNSKEIGGIIKKNNSQLFFPFQNFYVVIEFNYEKKNIEKMIQKIIINVPFLNKHSPVL